MALGLSHIKKPTKTDLGSAEQNAFGKKVILQNYTMHYLEGIQT